MHDQVLSNQTLPFPIQTLWKIRSLESNQTHIMHPEQKKFPLSWQFLYNSSNSEPNSKKIESTSWRGIEEQSLQAAVGKYGEVSGAVMRSS